MYPFAGFILTLQNFFIVGWALPTLQGYSWNPQMVKFRYTAEFPLIPTSMRSEKQIHPNSGNYEVYYISVLVFYSQFFTLCPKPQALCAMPHALCAKPHAPCPMRHAPCPLRLALCAMPYALSIRNRITLVSVPVKTQPVFYAELQSMATIQSLPPAIRLPGPVKCFPI